MCIIFVLFARVEHSGLDRLNSPRHVAGVRRAFPYPLRPRLPPPENRSGPIKRAAGLGSSSSCRCRLTRSLPSHRRRRRRPPGFLAPGDCNDIANREIRKRGENDDTRPFPDDHVARTDRRRRHTAAVAGHAAMDTPLLW